MARVSFPHRLPASESLNVVRVTVALLFLTSYPITAATVSLPERTLYLPAGVAALDVLLRVHVAGAGANCTPVLTAKDLALTPFPQVTAGEASVKVPAGKDCNWYFPLKLANVPPNLTQERKIELTLGNAKQVLTYVLTNQSFALTVKASNSAWPIRGDVGRTWRIGMAEGPAMKVRLAGCWLDGPLPFDCDQLQLCTGSPTTCQQAFNLPKGLSPLYLRVKDGFRQPGTYEGSVFLVADTRPTPETLPVKISYTSLPLQLLGIFCILLGVVLGFFVTVYARAQVARDRALFAVAALGEAIRRLRQDLNGLLPTHAGDVQATKTALEGLLTSLSPKALDGQGFLPTVFGGPGDAPAYQAFLTGVGEHLSMLKVIVAGMLTAVTMQAAPTPADPDPHARVLKALDRLDASIQPPSADTARTQVQQILSTLAPLVKEAIVRKAAPAGPPTAESLLIDIERLGWASWLVWLVITVVVGYLAQVDKPGFGTLVDFLVCLLWGLGLPAAGQQLALLTPTTIATTLKVPVP